MIFLLLNSIISQHTVSDKNNRVKWNLHNIKYVPSVMRQYDVL